MTACADNVLPKSIEIPSALCFCSHVTCCAETEIAEINLGTDSRPQMMQLGLTIFYLANGKAIVVCTEISSNTGKSVTNAWPTLAERLVDFVDPGVRQEQIVFVEHYFPGSYSSEKTEETFDIVDVTWRNKTAISHRWERVR